MEVSSELQDPEASRSETTHLSSSMPICIEESASKYRIPVVNNRVLIRGGEARIFKTTSETGYDKLSEESVVEAIMFDTECNSDSLVCVLIREDKKKDEKTVEKAAEPQVVELDESLKLEEDLDWDISSEEEEEIKEADSIDASALPATLKLLEQVSYRILGEKTVTIPEIEKVEEQEKDESVEKKTSSRQVMNEQVEFFGDAYREYLDAVTFAENFVDSLLISAKQVCKAEHQMRVAVVGFKGHRKHNIIWPTIKEFDVELGIESIDMYIQHGFILKEAWKYKITYLIGQSDKASDFYLFEAKFCMPTACYPIAQATVSVFFTIEVSRVIPKKFPVSVTFTLESLRTVMVAGEVEINDKTLLIVLYSKLAVYKELFF